jgi:hypothetical protein
VIHAGSGKAETASVMTFALRNAPANPAVEVGSTRSEPEPAGAEKASAGTTLMIAGPVIAGIQIIRASVQAIALTATPNLQTKTVFYRWSESYQRAWHS